MNCLFIPFATLDGYQTGANITAKDISRSAEIYLKNICVAAVSAKINGTKDCPDTEIAVVTNIDVPEDYKAILEKNDIKIIHCPFDSFNFGAKYKWSLAFYKLCALKFMLDNYDYDSLAFVDADVFVQGSLKYMWEEAEHNILLYDIVHGLQVEHYNHFVEEVNHFMPLGLITHRGGEFYAANRSNCNLFMKFCIELFNQMKEQDFVCSTGDEFITSIVAEKLKERVKNAAPYIFRFWTSAFYLTTTQYKYNPVTILHVPGEKSLGMVKIFDKYISRGKFPPKESAWNMLHLKHPSLRVRLSRIYHHWKQ